MKPIVFDVFCVQTPVSSSSGKYYNLFGVWNLFTSINKNEQLLSSVIGSISDQIKIYFLVKFKVFSSHLTVD